MLTVLLLYKMDHFRARKGADERWNCFCDLKIQAVMGKGIRMACNLRVTAEMYPEKRSMILDMIPDEILYCMKKKDQSYF